MPENRKGMHKEWHSKRVNLEVEIVLEFVGFLKQTYNFEEMFGTEVAQAYFDFCNALYKKREGLKVEEYCGAYLVEYGYNWVTDSTQEDGLTDM